MVTAFDPAGTMIATGANDGQVRLWSAQGEALAVLEGHDDAINDLAFSPDGQRLVSASSDTTLRSWSRDGRGLALLEGQHRMGAERGVRAQRHPAAVGRRGCGVRWQADGQLLAVPTGHADAVPAALGKAGLSPG